MEYLPFRHHNAPLDRIFRGRTVDLLVLNRQEAQTVAPTEPYLVISITDPEREQAGIADSPFRQALLRLRFHYVAGVTNPILKPFAPPEDVPMSPEDATRLLDFIRENLGAARLTVCHCEMGVSRSAAVAAALSRILNEEDAFFFSHYLPNRWVYNLLIEHHTRTAAEVSAQPA